MASHNRFDQARIRDTRTSSYLRGCRRIGTLLGLGTAFLLAGCGGGGGNDDLPPDPGAPASGPGPGTAPAPAPAPTYSIGGSVSGMTGSGLVIRNNAADELTIDAAGPFAFATELGDGAGYDVIIVTHPTSPDNVCTLDNASGSVAAADVDSVQILCTGPLALLDIQPTDGDQNVSRRARIGMTFSADVDPATALPNTFSLVSDAGAVELAIDVDGADVALAPADWLLPLTDYTFTVSTDLLGSGGERLPYPLTTTFRTREAAWQADIAINTPGGAANDAQVAFDQSGNALAIWYQESASGTDLWSSYYDVDSGWEAPELVEHNDADLYAGGPRAGFNADGDALVVWTQTVGPSGGNVWSNAYIPGAGWGTPSVISTGGEVIGVVEMAVHGSGDAVAVWVEFDGSNLDVFANRYTVSGGWEGAGIIDDVDATVSEPRIAIDTNGNALAVWEQDEASPISNVWGSRYAALSGWETPVLISTNNNGVADGPRPAFDANGNALVVYAQDFGFERGMYAARFTSPGGWETPELIGPSAVGQIIEQQNVAFDPDGNAIATWEQPVQSGGSVVISAYASRYTAGAGWAAAQSIDHGTDVFYPKIAFDASGHGIAVWYELNLSLPLATGYSVWSNRYTSGSGWTSAEQIGSHGTLIGTFMPSLAMDPNGSAFAIWTRAGEVRVNRFE